MAMPDREGTQLLRGNVCDHILVPFVRSLLEDKLAYNSSSEILGSVLAPIASGLVVLGLDQHLEQVLTMITLKLPNFVGGLLDGLNSTEDATMACQCMLASLCYTHPTMKGHIQSMIQSMAANSQE